MPAVHAALIGSYRTRNTGIMMSNYAAHVSWTEHAACQWNGQAHVLSVMNVEARVAQRRHARFHPLVYAARSMPGGSIGSPLERGAGVHADRSGLRQTRSKRVSAPPPPPAWVIIKAWVRSGTLGPYCGRPGPHTGGSGSHSRGSVRTRGGPGPTWRFGPYIQGSDTLPWGSELTVDALEYITFSGHVAAPEPSMWWGRVLLLAQSSHPRLGRVTVWPHAQLLYHVTKVVRGTLV
jgi:hypothetical protein